MNVCFATYQSVMMLKGGPRTQIFQTKRALEKLGVNVTLFDSWKELDKNSIDLFHFFGANIGTYHLAREVQRLGIPFVVSPIFYTRHNNMIVRAVVSFDSFLHSFLNGVWSDYGLIAEICSWSKVVLPNTNDEATLMREGLGVNNSKVQVIPNGVEERFYRADPSLFKNKYGVDHFILNVGHIGPWRKNIFRLIQALQGIGHPSVIIGRIENSEEGRLCLQEAKKNPRLLIIDSMQNDSDLLSSAYAACDTFVLPSYYETPGIAALEAAIAGAKVVITPHGGTKDYFGMEAIYVEPDSTENIRNGILQSLQQKKTLSLSERIKKEYVWERVGEKLKKVYEEIAL